MSMRTLEAAILSELRQVTGQPKIRQKDIMEWSTGQVKCGDDEVVFSLPGLSVNVAVKKAAIGKKLGLNTEKTTAVKS